MVFLLASLQVKDPFGGVPCGFPFKYPKKAARNEAGQKAGHLDHRPPSPKAVLLLGTGTRICSFLIYHRPPHLNQGFLHFPLLEPPSFNGKLWSHKMVPKNCYCPHGLLNIGELLTVLVSFLYSFKPTQVPWEPLVETWLEPLTTRLKFDGGFSQKDP